jgi:hypothetical protein
MLTAQADGYATTPEDVLNNASSLTAADLSQSKYLQGNTKLRRNVQNAMSKPSTMSSRAKMPVHQLRGLKKDGALHNNRFPVSTSAAAAPRPRPTATAVVYTGNSRGFRNGLSSTPMDMTQGYTPPNPLTESSMNSVEIVNPTPTTIPQTPVTSRLGRVRQHFAVSDDPEDEDLYEEMVDEGNPHNAVFRNITLDLMNAGLDTPMTIQKVKKRYKKKVKKAAAATLALAEASAH